MCFLPTSEQDCCTFRKTAQNVLHDETTENEKWNLDPDERAVWEKQDRKKHSKIIYAKVISFPNNKSSQHYNNLYCHMDDLQWLECSSEFTNQHNLCRHMDDLQW